jgi:superkiller protein 3
MAIEYNPNDSLAYQNLGVALKNYGKLDDAIAAHRKATELDPSNAAAYVNLASTLLDQGKLDEAVTACRKAIELKFDHFAVYNNLGLALKGQGKFDEAIAAYRKAINLKPDFVNAYANLINVLQARRKSDEAAAVFRKIVELKPDNANDCNALAWLLVASPTLEYRDPNRAIELAARATELAPRDGNIWNTLGIARYRAGQWQSAIDGLNKAMELRSGGDASDWFFLAMSHWQLGHKEEARMWFDKAVEWTDKNQPKNEELIRFRAEAAELLGITETQDPQP